MYSKVSLKLVGWIVGDYHYFEKSFSYNMTTRLIGKENLGSYNELTGYLF
jgi:hypothetical protein